MPKRFTSILIPLLKIAGLFTITLLLIFCVQILTAMRNRPPRIPLERPLYAGVTYSRQIFDTPRPLVMHTIKIDLTEPNIRFFVTPRTAPADSGHDYAAQRTSDFLNQHNLQIAINGDYFDPFYAWTPFLYYPKDGDFVNVKSQAISDGQLVTDPNIGHPTFCIGRTGHVSLHERRCPDNTQQAMGGKPIFMKDGVIVSDWLDQSDYLRETHPRTVIAIDKPGRTVWLVLVDGRQPGYSEGLGLQEMIPFLLDLGATEAMALDGGGSTTLVIEENGASRILNAPIHVGLPLQERPVANHLGIYADPLSAE